MMARMVWLAAVLVLSSAISASGQTEVQQALRLRLEDARGAARLDVGGNRVVDAGVIAEAYRQRGYAPLWTDDRRRERLYQSLQSLYEDGLDGRDCYSDELRRGSAGVRTAQALADEDLVHSLALLRAAHQLRFGRLDPVTLAPAFELSRPLYGSDASTAARALLEADPVAALRRMRPDHFAYTGLVSALAALREAQRTGGWNPVPIRRLALDSTGEAVIALRRRLVREGDLPGGADTMTAVFDSAVMRAVQAYQMRHALTPDGIVGPATHHELGVPLDGRIEQVRLNLERVRWHASHLGTTHIAVNAAAARVVLFRNGVVVTEARSIVGKPGTGTPAFTASLREIELNPTWTVPPGIVGEVLASIRRDPDYLRRQGMRVIDRSGREVDRRNVDFRAYTGRTFPYVFRQDAGPLNPLGRIKFVLPNPHHVYLHDTPARQLFDMEQRTFSHGCIRVQNPVALAALVLADPTWSEPALQRAIATGATRRIPLMTPMPVTVFYWTAAATDCGSLHFYRDVYGRDPALARALDKPST
jgi:L,D-transpeptidase YcbB